MRDFSYFCTMAGLYIHIPFCKSKCAYCGFYSLPSLKLKDRFLEALKEEIVARKDYLQRERLRVKPAMTLPHEDGCDLPSIETIYFGGGTPSLLTIEEIRGVLHLINMYVTVAENAEITLEANPDTLSLDYLLKQIKDLGFSGIIAKVIK